MQRYWIDPDDIYDDEGNTSIQCEFEELEEIVKRPSKEKQIETSLTQFQKNMLLPRETARMMRFLERRFTDLENPARKWLLDPHQTVCLAYGFSELQSQEHAVELIFGVINVLSDLNPLDQKAGGDIELLMNLPLSLLEAKNKNTGTSISLLPAFYEVASWTYKMWFDKSYPPRGEWIAKQLVAFYRSKITPILQNFFKLVDEHLSYDKETDKGYTEADRLQGQTNLKNLLKNYMGALVFYKYGRFLPTQDQLPRLLPKIKDREDFMELYTL
jgi:hypothetical protein